MNSTFCKNRMGVQADSAEGEFVWIPHFSKAQRRVQGDSAFVELSIGFLKNAEFTWTPPLRSPLELPLCGVRVNSPLFFYNMHKSAWTLHCLFEKCGVHTNSPSVESASTPPLQSLLELPFCFYKMRSSFQLPTPFLHNLQSTWTSHCLFKNCGVCLNSPLCFCKMRSSHKLPLYRVHLNSHCVFKRCRVQTNSPLCSPKMQSLFQLPICFYKMRSPLELPTVLVKNGDFTQTPPLRSPLELPFCFYKMRNSNELPTMSYKNVVLFQLPTCFYKLRSSRQLPTLFLQHVQVHFNSPLSFEKCGVDMSSWSTILPPASWQPILAFILQWSNSSISLKNLSFYGMSKIFSMYPPSKSEDFHTVLITAHHLLLNLHQRKGNQPCARRQWLQKHPQLWSQQKRRVKRKYHLM